MRDLTQGPVGRHVLQLSAFIALSTFFQTLYLVVDLYFVGRLGKEAVAGVAVAGNLMMVVLALTQTLGPSMGSGVVTPGLGFLYASTLGGYLGRMEAGERARSFISPVLVLKDGKPVLALGAAGGARIVSGVTQVISRVIDDGMTLAEALEAPRVHMDWDGRLNAETSPVIGWTPAQIEDMRRLGLDLAETSRPGAFSRVHAVQFDPETGTWYGAADPDWEGSARGPTPARVGG